MSNSGGFHDLLFELSNENRYGILLSLRDRAQRITDLTNEMGLNTTEVRRHVARLGEVGLIRRDLDGYYNLTHYGEMVLTTVQEFEFMERHREYFNSHSTRDIPEKLVKRIGDLRGSRFTGDVLDFIRQIESLIEEAEEYVWLIVDQFPLNFLGTINGAIERGVRFRLMEPWDLIFRTEFDELKTDELQSLNRAIHTPLVERSTYDHGKLYMYLSERSCILSFPTQEGEIDYKGFNSNDEASLEWCRDLFGLFWETARHGVKPPLDVEDEEEREMISVSEDHAVIEGRNDPSIDPKIVQDAVDNYGKVTLKGEFNFGTSSIKISRSVSLKGEGREDGIPLTKVKKQGWQFPSTMYEHLILVEGEGIDVTIENIHFTDFNNICLLAYQGNSIRILENRITLQTVLGRGTRFGIWGDQVIGILVSNNNEKGSFPGGTTVEGNYLDFATWYILGKFRPKTGRENEPDYRPDLDSHENYMSYGIVVRDSLGSVRVEENDVRNMNAKCIWILDNWDSSEILVKKNRVHSGVFGSYAINTNYAGYGICAFSHWEARNPRQGYRLSIVDNEIECSKVNYLGIAVHGPLEGVQGSVKLQDGEILRNRIYLDDGSVGVLIYRCDGFEVAENQISGKAYYGIQLTGGDKIRDLELSAERNIVKRNKMGSLEIKAPDIYSETLIDGQIFSCSREGSKTAYVWLNSYTRYNSINVSEEVSVIDEGTSNAIN